VSQQENTGLQSEYTDRVRADLEHNEAEQNRVRQEIEVLQAELVRLETDYELLRKMSVALGAGVETSSVPAPRAGRKPAGSARAGKPGKKTASSGKTAAEKSSTPVGRAMAKKRTARTAVAGGRKPAADGSPALGDLIHGHLTAGEEPRTATEIAQALAEAHPGRNTGVNLVRTTTERLVARGRAERVKQGSTVYYSAITTAAVDTQPAELESVDIAESPAALAAAAV
jgi:hypothetical protein